MARTLRNALLETRTARSRLKARGKPYYCKIQEGLHLGYRKPRGRRGAALPAGKWVLRRYVGEQAYELETIAEADDTSNPDGTKILSFQQAQDAARQRMEERIKAAGTEGAALTVRVVLDRYEKDLVVRGRSAENVKRVRAHLSDEMADEVAPLLTSRRLRTWRDGLLEDMEPASVNRVCTPLRAALNLAADLSEGKMNREPWEIGLKPIPVGDNSRNITISDRETLQVVGQAQSDSVQFGLLVEGIAVTGARPSQLARVPVAGLKDNLLEIPSSRKGRGGKKKSHEPVPIPMSFAARLREASRGKPQKSPLFTKPSGEPWKKSDHYRPFAGAAERAGLDPEVVTIYALRHSSITRQILANVPIRVIAVMHDTSVAMIEKNYSTAIAKASENIVRPVLFDIGIEPLRVASNVVAL
jgi:hypothetical protein